MVILAACIVVAALIYAGTLLPFGKLTPTAAAFSVGGALISAVIVAVVLPNTSALSHLIFKAGQYVEITADMQQTADGVHSDAAEVRQIKQRIDTSEKNVADMRDGIQHAYQALFKLLVYIMMTRNQSQVPPAVIQEIDRETMSLMAYAYPDPKERAKEDEKLHEFFAKNSLILPTPQNTPVPTPTR